MNKKSRETERGIEVMDSRVGWGQNWHSRTLEQVARWGHPQQMPETLIGISLHGPAGTWCTYWHVKLTQGTDEPFLVSGAPAPGPSAASCVFPSKVHNLVLGGKGLQAKCH